MYIVNPQKSAWDQHKLYHCHLFPIIKRLVCSYLTWQQQTLWGNIRASQDWTCSCISCPRCSTDFIFPKKDWYLLLVWNFNHLGRSSASALYCLHRPGWENLHKEGGISFKVLVIQHAFVCRQSFILSLTLITQLEQMIRKHYEKFGWDEIILFPNDFRRTARSPSPQPLIISCADNHIYTFLKNQLTLNRCPRLTRATQSVWGRIFQNWSRTLPQKTRWCWSVRSNCLSNLKTHSGEKNIGPEY